MGFWNSKAKNTLPDIQPWPPREHLLDNPREHDPTVAQIALAAATDDGEILRAVTPSLERNGVVTWIGLSDKRLFVLRGRHTTTGKPRTPSTIPFADIPPVIASPPGYAAVLPWRPPGASEDVHLAVTRRFLRVRAAIDELWARAAEQTPLPVQAVSTQQEDLSPRSPLWAVVHRPIPPSRDGWYRDPLNVCRARRFTEGRWSATSALLAGPANPSMPPPPDAPPYGARPRVYIPLRDIEDSVQYVHESARGIANLIPGLLDLEDIAAGVPDADDLRGVYMHTEWTAFQLDFAANEWLTLTPTNWATARHHTDELVRNWITDERHAIDDALRDVAATYAAYGWTLAAIEFHWGWARSDSVDLATVSAIGTGAILLDSVITGRDVSQEDWHLHLPGSGDEYRLSRVWHLPDRWRVVLAGYLAGRTTARDLLFAPDAAQAQGGTGAPEAEVLELAGAGGLARDLLDVGQRLTATAPGAALTCQQAAQALIADQPPADVNALNLLSKATRVYVDLATTGRLEDAGIVGAALEQLRTRSPFQTPDR